MIRSSKVMPLDAKFTRQSWPRSNMSKVSPLSLYSSYPEISIWTKGFPCSRKKRAAYASASGQSVVVMPAVFSTTPQRDWRVASSNVRYVVLELSPDSLVMLRYSRVHRSPSSQEIRPSSTLRESRNSERTVLGFARKLIVQGQVEKS